MTNVFQMKARENVDKSEVEIIGNIYENPELLREINL